MSDSKLQRTILRFQQKIDSGAFYEAHQTLRSIANRYVKSKQYSDAIDLLYQGSSILSKNKEYASASDLVSYLISVYQEANIKCVNEAPGREYKIKIIDLINVLPDSDPSLPDLTKRVILWSAEVGSSRFGDNDLHHVFGAKILTNVTSISNTQTEEDRQKLFAYAESHLILGTYESVPLYINFLYRWYKGSSASVSPGPFLGRAVINYCYLRNVKFAQESINIFISKLKSDNPGFELIEDSKLNIVHYGNPDYELIHFLQLLVLTLAKEDAGQKFMKLYDHYKNELTQYEMLSLVDYLGRLYFQLNLGQKAQGSNFLANFMGDLFK